MESECLSGEIAQRKALLKKLEEEDKDVTEVASWGNFSGSSECYAFIIKLSSSLNSPL